MKVIYKIAPVMLLALLTSCVGAPPVREYNLAHVSIEMAEKAGASKHAPGLLNQAQEAYARAQTLYNDRNYDQASEMFKYSRKLAEKAELQTKAKQFESGEGF